VEQVQVLDRGQGGKITMTHESDKDTSTEAKEPRPLETLVPLIKQRLTEADELLQKAYADLGELLKEAYVQFDMGTGCYERSYGDYDRGDPKDKRQWKSWVRKLKLNCDAAERFMAHARVKFRVPDDVAARAAERKSEKGKLWQKIMERNVTAYKAEPDLLRQIFESGFRAEAMKHHPDHGGSTEIMQRLNEVREMTKPKPVGPIKPFTPQ
jgi:hypothetical protein